MRKLEMVPPETETAMALKWGEWDEVPPGWRPINPPTFAASEFFYQIAQNVETRLIHDFPKTGMHVPAILFYYRYGIGIAIASYAAAPQYFRFGCDHKWKELSPEEAENLGQSYGLGFRTWQCERCECCMHTDKMDEG